MKPFLVVALSAFVTTSEVFAARCSSDLFFEDVVAFQRGGNLALKGSTCVIGGNPISVFESTAQIPRWQETKLTVAGAVAFDGNHIVRSLDGHVYVMQKPPFGQWNDVVELRPDPAINNAFGTAIAIDGDTVVVGSPLENDIEFGSNFVSVYRGAGGIWTQEALLITSNLVEGAPFGHAVAISGDTVVIGDLDREAAYIFARNGTNWEQQAKLTGSELGGFGVSVAIGNNTVVVGAYGEPTGFETAGAVYVFRRTGTEWSLETKFENHQMRLANFGYSVACDGDYVLASSLIGKDGVTEVWKRSLIGTEWCWDNSIRGETPAISGSFIFTRDNVYFDSQPPFQLVLFTEISVASAAVRELVGQLEVIPELPLKILGRLSSHLTAAAKDFDIGRTERGVAKLRSFERSVRRIGPRYFGMGTTSFFIIKAESIIDHLGRPRVTKMGG